MDSRENQGRKQDLIALISLGVLAIFFFLSTPGQWIDISLDSGYNLYVFWRLAEGDILYRDLAYYHGPLAALLNGFMGKAFGASSLTFALFGLFIIIATTSLIYLSFQRALSRRSSYLLGLLFLCAFAFSHVTEGAVFNYLLPYKPELPLGIACVAALFWIFSLLLEQRSRHLITVAGLLLGSLLLLSYELLAGALVTSFIYLLFYIRRWHQESGLRKGGFIFLLSLFTPLLLVTLYFSRYFPWLEAVELSLSSVMVPLRFSSLLSGSFARSITGLDNPIPNLYWIGKSLLWLSAYWLGIASFVRFSGQSRLRPLLSQNWVPVVFALQFSFLYPKTGLLWLSLAFPLLSLLATLIFFRQSLRGNVASLFLATWGIFGCILVVKILLTARMSRYGVFLILPATLISGALFLEVIPRYLARWVPNRAWLESAGIGLVLALIGGALVLSLERMRLKTFTLVAPHEAIQTESLETSTIGPVTQMTLDWIAENTSPSQTVLALPQGDLILFLAKRKRPIPFTYNFIETRINGEEKILSAIRDHAPDIILTDNSINRDIARDAFGLDPLYGKATLAWIKENYLLATYFGWDKLPPTPNFSIQVWTKK